MKHTKGSWHVVATDIMGFYNLIEASTGGTAEEHKYNMFLMEAAPDLLLCLLEAKANIIASTRGNIDEKTKELLGTISSAIAKAKGE